MMMKYPTLILKLLTTIYAGCLLVLLVGCVGLGGGDTTPTLYYTLEGAPVPEMTDSIGESPVVVGLGKVEIPGYLDRKEFVVRTGSNELRYTANHLWAERPGDALPRLLALNIERQADSPVQVHALPWPDFVDPQFALHVDVLAFEGRESPVSEVRLEISWRIQNLKDGTIAKTGSFRSADRDWVGGDYSDLVEGLSEELVKVGHLVGMDLSTVATN